MATLHAGYSLKLSTGQFLHARPYLLFWLLFQGLGLRQHPTLAGSNLIASYVVPVLPARSFSVSGSVQTPQSRLPAFAEAATRRQASVLTSRLATLRLTNASRHSLPRCITGTPAHKGLTPSGLSLIAQRTLIYLPFKAHTQNKRH